MSTSNIHLQNPIKWTENFNAAFLFEVATEKVAPLLPKGVVPLETRPTISLILVSPISFPKGNLNKLSTFKEISWAIVVQPILFPLVPTPKFCFFVGNIAAVGATANDFLEHGNIVDKMPAYYSDSLEITIGDSDKYNARDEHGIIFDFRANVSYKNYQKKLFWGQNINLHQGCLCTQTWNWEGNIVEHQKNVAVGQCFDHLFLMD